MPNREGKLVVLAVDDHPSILRFVQIGLEMRGLETITADSGVKALDLAESQKPDIILLDVLLPDMDGLQVLRRLRALSQVPIIVFSAKYDAREESLRLGANEFVAKPFNTDHMVSRIRDLLEQRGKGSVDRTG